MTFRISLSLFVLVAMFSLTSPVNGQEAPAAKTETGPSAEQLLANPTKYPAFCYGGFRKASRDQVPSVEEIKEDLRILAAMKVKLLRTYNTQQFKHAEHLLQAIKELKVEDSDFEMYVMLGAWINCENAWTKQPNHDGEGTANNTAEVEAAVSLANRFPGQVKVIAVGNEAMVHWAASYFVQPGVILKWVNHLQDLKQQGKLAKDIWITSSDNFAAWGGEGAVYHKDDLVSLIKAVDYVSLHTYPFHDTYEDPDFWVDPDQGDLSKQEVCKLAIGRAVKRAKKQYQGVVDYIASHGIEKPIHIGETGWATVGGMKYGVLGTCAADQYKAALYYASMREWTSAEGISCFFFEAFNEIWKDPGNPLGTENNFGIIDDNRVKFALWEDFDAGVFDGLTRGGKPLVKSHKGGDEKVLDSHIQPVPTFLNFDDSLLTDIAKDRKPGEPVTERSFVVIGNESAKGATTRPSRFCRVNAWEGTCEVSAKGGEMEIVTGTGGWWGCGIELQGAGKGENLEQFKDGKLHFDIRGESECEFVIGFQSGRYVDGNQVDAGVIFGPGQDRSITFGWDSWSIPVSKLTKDKSADLSNVSTLLFLKGKKDFDGKMIRVRNVYFSK